MIKSAPPLLTDEVLICVDLPVGDGASTSRFNWYALNNTGGTQMQPAVDDMHANCVVICTSRCDDIQRVALMIYNALR